MKVSAQFAEEHFADIVDAASNGEVVEISLSGGPSLRLTAMEPDPQSRPKGKRILGAGRGELRVPSEEEWCAMDKELEQLMNDGPLFPSEPA